MLAPDVSTMTSQMTDAYNSVVSMDGFSTSVVDLQVIKLQHDPDWLPPVRTELDNLRTQAGNWNAKRPDIWAPFLVAVSNYVSMFESVAAAGKNDLDTAAWLELLGPLLTTLDDINTKLQSAETEFSDLRGQIAAILPSIDKSIQAGWAALGQEEAEMEDLATQLGNLSAQATAANQKIDSDAISENKQIITTSVKMLYAVATAGAEASIPILGIAVHRQGFLRSHRGCGQARRSDAGHHRHPGQDDRRGSGAGPDQGHVADALRGRKTISGDPGRDADLDRDLGQ